MTPVALDMLERSIDHTLHAVDCFGTQHIQIDLLP